MQSASITASSLGVDEDREWWAPPVVLLYACRACSLVVGQTDKRKESLGPSKQDVIRSCVAFVLALTAIAT